MWALRALPWRGWRSRLRVLTVRPWPFGAGAGGSAGQGRRARRLWHRTGSSLPPHPFSRLCGRIWERLGGPAVQGCAACALVLCPPSLLCSLRSRACGPCPSHFSLFLSFGSVLRKSFKRTQKPDVLTRSYAEHVIKCHDKGKAGQSGCFPVQMNKIQPFLSSATCFTWTGPITALGGPGADVLQCLQMKLALVVSPVLEQMCHRVHLC